MFQAMVNFFYEELQDFWLKSGTFGKYFDNGAQ